MNVYDTANKLAAEIKEAKEYADYKKLKDSINSNPEKKQKIESFEKMRYDIQVKSLQGQNLEKETSELQTKYAELQQDEEIKQYFDAEVRFNVLIADVNKIIAEAVKEVL